MRFLRVELIAEGCPVWSRCSLELSWRAT